MNEWITKVARAIHGVLFSFEFDARAGELTVNEERQLAQAAIAELLPLMKAELAKVARDYGAREVFEDKRGFCRAVSREIAAAIEAWEPEA